MSPEAPDLELRDLRVFVTVATAGSFSAAATELFVSQPAVSRAIARLESSLGVAVLERSTHHIALTGPGTTLLEHAHTVLAAAASAVRLTRRRAEPAGLVVALHPDSDAGLLPAVLARYEAEAELPPVRLWFADKHELAPAVRTGRADVALLTGLVHDEGLESEPVWDEPRVAVLPAGHPLAHREQPALGELLAGPVVTWPTLSPDTDRYFRGCDNRSDDDRSDRELATGPEAGTLADALRLVELGRAVTFLPQSVASRFARPELVCRPVEGLTRSTAALVWRVGSRDRAVAAFVRATSTAADERDRAAVG